MQRLIEPFLNKLRFIRKMVKNGFFSSKLWCASIPDRDEVLAYIRSRGPIEPELKDVDLHSDSQFKLLEHYLQFYKDLPFPEKQVPQYRYFYDNTWFSYADAIYLCCFLRMHTPARIVEIGSGFSSAVILDTVDNFYPTRPEITFIEPQPERLESLLRKEDKSHVTLIDKKLQEVSSEVFSSLEEGDFLFIDSSHILRCGSDLQRILFEILPVLPPGVFVHFHDVFYPFDYPAEWLLEGRYCNENYFLHAFLAYNCEWSIYFFSTYAAFAFSDFLKTNMPMCLKNPGGSLYLKREKKKRLSA